MTNKLQVQLVPTDSLEIPLEFLREKPSRVEDDVLANSIKKSGVQQPLIVYQEEAGKYTVIDGGRRLALARSIGIPKLRVVIAEIPEGVPAKVYAQKIRFILDQHRQDLMPSQKADLIVKMKEVLGIGNTEVAQFLGVESDSVRNWLMVKEFAPEVVESLDKGDITAEKARVFVGMTENAQKWLLKHHSRDFQKMNGKVLHKHLRKMYSPKSHPKLYNEPEKLVAKLDTAKKGGKGRKAKARPNYSVDEKKKLLVSVEMKESELAELKQEHKELKQECVKAAPAISAIARNKKIWEILPDNVKEEFDRFLEVY